MSDCFSFGFFVFFPSVCAVVKQAPVLFSTPHKEPVRKLALSVFPETQRHNAHFGHRTSNLTIIARRCNQVSYAFPRAVIALLE